MQIEGFFYWFTDPEWWLGATQGTVGALIGFIGLFIVFRLTRSHDIKRDREAREEERNRIIDERNLAGIVDIYQKILTVRVRSSVQTRQEDVDDLVNSLMLFSLRESVDYPITSRWTYELSWCFDTWSKKELEHGDLFIYGQAGSLAGALSGWVEEGRLDYLFEGRDVEKEWEKEYAELKEEQDESEAQTPSTTD